MISRKCRNESIIEGTRVDSQTSSDLVSYIVRPHLRLQHPISIVLFILVRIFLGWSHKFASGRGMSIDSVVARVSMLTVRDF